MNYFLPNSAAERYSKGRPDFHSNTIQHIAEFLKLENKINNVLDVACGTGLSTQALLAISNHTYGTDSSKSMLDFALQKNKIKYQFATATEQPFENNFFDLITVCSGIHWFEIDKFLFEANRLLKSKSWLILYDNFFLGEMEGNSEFKNWYETIYLKAFPSPLRNDKYNWTNANLNKVNFSIVYFEEFKNIVLFNLNELALYFTTQSNVISSVEKKLVTYQEVEEWLKVELSTFFPNENNQAVLHFGNWIKYLQNTKH